ncbi:hypothetical protein [Tsukamurella pulmonis]|uniref:hypothetical protein n=1 Tax=Tsukamurella pulmonis TaxID=47312 RepID=UPI000B321E61|nr:hypothetical protein [Tsukamurella pulmonis]
MGESETDDSTRGIGTAGCVLRVLSLAALLLALLVAVFVVIYAPELHEASRRIREPGGRWFGREWPAWLAVCLWLVTGVLAAGHLVVVAVIYGYALMASVRRLFWCTHRLRAVRRWRPIAAAAGIGPVRRWAALRAGTNDSTKRSIRRLWAARTPPWLGRGLFLIGVVATLGPWVAAGADLTSTPSGLVIFVFVALIYLSDERAPSVFAPHTADGGAKAE